jgi:NAD(P)-dependent dehydrogenase (short-subunit alcohol dehydrogenase family)
MRSAMDLEGRTCVITGANTGIGLVTARELARRGARVVLACRSRDKTEPAITEIKRATGNSAVDFLALDLASLDQVRSAAAELLGRGHSIDLLIDNAGLAGQRGLTTDGFELHFGVNHLGHFLFTTLLLDRIKAAAPARIVVVASASHYQAKSGIDFDLVRRRTPSYVGTREYAVSKLANVLFAAELGRRLAGTGVTTYSLHPGVIASDIWRRVPFPARQIARAFMKTTEEGAQTSLWCATAPELAGETGKYYTDKAEKKPSRHARDPQLAAELWRRSEAWVAGDR